MQTASLGVESRTATAYPARVEPWAVPQRCRPMRVRLQKLANDAADAFWLVPSALVLVGLALAWGLVAAERGGHVPDAILAVTYGGGETGARTLLGAIVGSTITVAGTLFSITIAALTLASSQMGPRLLNNFTRDVGNQLTLGVLLGTFAYALVLLRTVRGGEAEFVPQLALSVALALAVACIGVLIYFVHHVASRINVDTVIDLVHRDLERSIARLTEEGDETAPPAPALEGGGWVREGRMGYVQQVDWVGLSRWAADHGAVIHLLVGPGDYVHAEAFVARVSPTTAEAHEAVRAALVLGRGKAGYADLEYCVDQLVEVAARALSSGVNDPMTASRVLDRLGAALCSMAGRSFPGPSVACEGRVVLVRKPATYEGLADAMFNIIRQSGASQPAVMTHMLDVLRQVALCERRPDRLPVLRRHAALALEDGSRAFANPADRADLEARHERFAVAATLGEPSAQA